MYYINRLVRKIKEREFSELEFNDFFPLNEIKDDGVKDLLVLTGIYLGAIIFSIFLIILLGSIFILGPIVKVIFGIICIYSVIGLFGGLLAFMKYN